MRATTVNHEGRTEVTILARLLGMEQGTLPSRMARFILQRDFSEADKARMHDLATRNQDDALSTDEKAELLAYAKAGTLLSLLKSSARRALGVKAKRRTTPSAAHGRGA